MGELTKPCAAELLESYTAERIKPCTEKLARVFTDASSGSIRSWRNARCCERKKNNSICSCTEKQIDIVAHTDQSMSRYTTDISTLFEVNELSSSLGEA